MAGIWRKTLLYLGFIEDDEYDDEFGYDNLDEDHAPAPRRRDERSQPPVGARRGRRPEDRAERPERDAVVRAMPTPADSGRARFHLVMPSSFNDAQEVGDKFRDGVSVLMNLQVADEELTRRLVDFASGLAYGLGGSMRRVAERVFLITPPGVQVSAEEQRRLLEERGFFNQA